MKKILSFILLFTTGLFISTSCSDEEERMYTIDYERGVHHQDSVYALKMIEYNNAGDSIIDHTLMFRTGNIKSLHPHPQSTQLEILIDDTLRVQDLYPLNGEGRTYITINDQTVIEKIK